MWFPAQSISPAKTATYRPGLAMHNGKLHMVFPDPSTKMLQHGVFTPSASGGSWVFSTISGQSSGNPVALVEYNGVLTALFQATNSSKCMFVSTLDDGTGAWTSTGFPSLTMQFGPSVAVHGDLLYAALVPLGGSSVQYATWNGSAWSNALSVNGVTSPTTSVAPALASYRDGLHLLFSTSSGVVDHYRWTAFAVPNQAFIPLASTGLTTTSSISATEWNGLLYALFRQTTSGAGQNTVVAATFDGGSWSQPVSTGTTTASTGAGAGPAVAAQGEMLQRVFTDSSSNILQGSGFAGGGAPPSYTPIVQLNGQASIQTGVPYSMFASMCPYTVEAWVNVSTTAGTQYIVSSVNTASGGVSLMALAIQNGHFAACRNGGWIQSQTPVVAGQWHHVALTFDGESYVCLYVDGNLERLDINNQPAAVNARGAVATGPVMIGAGSNGTGGSPVDKLQGMLRWVALWSVGRSAEEISNDLYAEPAPQPGLMALYNFAGGTVADISGRGQAAPLSGSPAYVAEAQGLLVNGSNGVDCGTGLNGSTNYLSFAGNHARTVEAWVRVTSVPAMGYVVLRNGEYSLGVDRNTGWFGAVAGQATLSAGAAPALNQWTHLAITWSPSGSTGTAVLYVNGSPVKTVSQSATATAFPNNHTTIGASSSGSSGVVGYVASARIWSRALAANEVQTAMTESPVGMANLAANYDFGSAPIVDATNNNTLYSITDPSNPSYPGTQLWPKTFGSTSPTLGFVYDSLTQASAAALLGVDTSASTPYLPMVPGATDPYQTGPITPSAPSPAPAAAAQAQATPRARAPRTVDDVLTPAFFQQLVDTFHRSLPPGTGEGVRKHLAAEYAAKVERMFLLARHDPRHGLGGHRFEWKRRGEHVVLLHSRPDGTVVEATALPADALSAQTLWAIQFALTLVFGFASILGVSPGGSAAKKLTQYITNNPTILAIMEEVGELAVAISTEVVMGTLGKLWNSSVLKPMVMIIAQSLSWWALAKLAVKLGSMFLPGAQGIAVATMLVNFTIMAIQLSMLALEYPR